MMETTFRCIDYEKVKYLGSGMFTDKVPEEGKERNLYQLVGIYEPLEGESEESTKMRGVFKYLEDGIKELITNPETMNQFRRLSGMKELTNNSHGKLIDVLCEDNITRKMTEISIFKASEKAKLKATICRVYAF